MLNSLEIYTSKQDHEAIILYFENCDIKQKQKEKETSEKWNW